MRAILDFEHRKRPTPLLKELLSLPFMSKQAEPQHTTEAKAIRRAEGEVWRNRYKGLTDAPVQEKLELKKIQEEALETNVEEDHIERAPKQLKG